jgi:subtilisin family serine protease
MKNLHIIFISFLFSCNALLFAGEAALSVRTKLLIDEYSSVQRAKGLEENIIGEKIIKLFIFVDEHFDESSLENLDAFVETRNENILTVSIPLKNLNALGDIEGIGYIRAGMPVKQRLNTAVPLVRANLVNSGFEMQYPYKGMGVVIGVIDMGLDFTHPTFRSENGRYKISRVWIQDDYRGSLNPANFRYGREYRNESELLSAQYSSNQNSHGTHVTGIAGGSGGNSIYKGVAPDSELVFVETEGTDPEIVDAVNYIFQYAQSVNKPAVVNISLGSHFGPHDGTSPTDIYFDQLSGAGKIIVGAAGNEGDVNLYINHSFSSETDTLRSIINVDKDDLYNNYVDIWGEANSKIDFAIEVYDLQTKKIVASTSFGSTASNFSVDESWDLPNGRVVLSMASRDRYEANRKPNVEVYIQNPNYENYGVAILLKGSAGKTIKMWNNGSGYGAPFTTLSDTGKSGWIEGSTTSTVSEIGGTGNSVISVGSYNSKNEWTNISGQTYGLPTYTLGEISPWSSIGPTADGRTKPDITAPGSVIVSSVNSFNSPYLPGGSSEVELVYKDNTSHYYAIMQGTSMAAPVVTGAVALMLQKNPDLTSQEIKNLFKQYSIKDNFTGSIGEGGSNTWGYGKLDVYSVINSKEIGQFPEIKNIFLYYTAASKTIGIALDIDTDYELIIDKVEVFDIAKRKIVEKNNLSKSEWFINAYSFPPGMYIVKITVGKNTIREKILVF